MTAPLHPDEPDAGPARVRALLRRHVPSLAHQPLRRLHSTGSDNVIYRLGTRFTVRLPRFPDAADRLGIEVDWLPRLVQLPTTVPEIAYVGPPDEDYPHPWAVLRWLDGDDGWAARDHANWFGAQLGADLAVVVRGLRGFETDGLPVRQPGERGGPLGALDDRVRWWLDQGAGLVDGPAVLRLWDRCLEGAAGAGGAVEPVLLHGDLIPGNLLVTGGRLSAVLDWGGLGAGDPAQDLDPAWSVLDDAGAAAFRDELDVDDAAWLRGRGFALEHAIGAVIHYVPRRHPLGEVMQRSLERLLSRP